MRSVIVHQQNGRLTLSHGAKLCQPVKENALADVAILALVQDSIRWGCFQHLLRWFNLAIEEQYRGGPCLPAALAASNEGKWFTFLTIGYIMDVALANGGYNTVPWTHDSWSQPRRHCRPATHRYLLVRNGFTQNLVEAIQIVPIRHCCTIRRQALRHTQKSKRCLQYGK